MFEKYPKFKKILDLYIGIFFIFGIISVNNMFIKILEHFNISNMVSNFFAFLITLASFIYMIYPKELKR